PPVGVAFGQVVGAVEPEVPAGWLVAGELDGQDGRAEQVLGVYRLAGRRQAWRSPHRLSPSMTGPRSAPAGVRLYQTSRLPGSRSAVRIPESSSSRRRWLSVLGVIPPRRSIRSVNLLGPVRRSRITSRLHRSPTRSRVRAVRQKWS